MPQSNILDPETQEAYFKRLDKVVSAAKQNQIGLIPSLFWHMPPVPDLVEEPMDQYGNPHSRTLGVSQYNEQDLDPEFGGTV